MDIDYSVIIRTTGKAGEKYKRLLNAIDALEPKPREVIVVLPEGYGLPEEQLGWETFYFCTKGMVVQRMTGIQLCKTPFALVCDDDVSFGSDFVQKLYFPIRDGVASLSAGPLYSFLPSGVSAIVDSITGAAVPTIWNKNRYCTVLKTTGYSYNRNLSKMKSFYETQSAAWTCFFADIEALRSIHFEDELWLDQHGYSALDDQTMFYKAWLRGHKTVIVPEAKYVHLDGKTSTRNNKQPVLFASCFNRVVFWHRYVFSLQNNLHGRIWSKLAFGYRLLWIYLYDCMDLARKRLTPEEFAVKRDGVRQGWNYIKSEEYRNLPPIV